MEAAARENRAKQPPQGTLPPEQTTTPVAAPAPVAAAPEPSRSEPQRTPVYKKWWLWTIVGVVVAAGVGVGLGVGLTQSSVSYPSASTTAGTVRF